MPDADLDFFRMPDPDLDFLRPLDPTLHDEPPSPGSPRYEAIRPDRRRDSRGLRMVAWVTGRRRTPTATPIRGRGRTVAATPVSSRTVAATPANGRGRTVAAAPISSRTVAATPANGRGQAVAATPVRGRRWMPWTVAAAGAAASVLATMVVLGGDGTSASAAVLTAAERTEKVVTLRGTTQDEIRTGGASTTTVEANGPDLKIMTQEGGGTITTTVIGDTVYESRSDGTSLKQKLRAGERLAPFAQSTGNVIRAALNDANVTAKGTDRVRGTEAEHYHVELTPKSRRALAALPRARPPGSRSRTPTRSPPSTSGRPAT
ncbi:hypothetical protein Asp14428_34450 [Actinoplanes sp. NBRC 14428]|nr:hypothetical protein Asp14428_34450 [Actinoplanes sp. NBRC 14428]